MLVTIPNGASVDPFLLAAGMNSKWLKRCCVEPAELFDEPWCLFDRHEFQLSVAKAFRAPPDHRAVRLSRLADR
jgi:hypothetical protein